MVIQETNTYYYLKAGHTIGLSTWSVGVLSSCAISIVGVRCACIHRRACVQTAVAVIVAVIIIIAIDTTTVHDITFVFVLIIAVVAVHHFFVLLLVHILLVL